MNEEIKLAKATVFVRGMFGFSAIEVHDLHVHFKKFAQYPLALHFEYRLPRARKRKGYCQGGCASLVVLPGWGHNVSIPDALSEAVNGSRMTRHASFAVEYDHEFEGALRAYLDSKPGQVVHDYREAK